MKRVASLLVAIASFISGALMAAPLSEAERELIVTSARKDPRGWGSQETLNVVRRLGAEGDLETLDLILSLNHTALLGIYGSGYRGARRNEAMPAIEERLVARYDDPRIAIELMRTVEKYQSKALLDRMLGDASRLAAMYADEAKRCRLVTVPSQAPAAAAQPPATHSFGVIAAPSGARKPVAGQQSPYAPPSGAHQGMIGGVISAQSVTLAPKLECDGAPPVQTPELWRMTEAIRILGNTDLPEAARRIRPHVVALSAAPALDGGAVAEAYLTSRMNDLRSIAELWGRERFVAGGPDLAAVAKKLPMRDLNNARAVWPLLKALAQMDLREGSETIAEWIDRRASRKILLNESPSLVEMIRLLGPVLPEGQIDVSRLRDRVLAAAPEQARTEYAAAFSAVETLNRNLRAPSEATLVSFARANNPRMVRYVLSRGISPNARDAEGETGVTAARPYFDMQKLLVEAGADPDLPGRQGMTPFHLAVAWFHPQAPDAYKVVDYFHAKGIDINRAAEQGTPLFTATERSPEMVKYLLDRGARMDLATREGLMPLHAAARGAKTPVARMLLAAGAPVDAKDRNAMTPLHYAVRARNVEVAQMLIERGADVNAEIYQGLTPLLMAQDNQDAALEALLKQHGGRVNLAYVAKREAMKKALELPYRERGH